MFRELLILQGLPVDVLKKHQTSGPKHIILVIPGNPGIVNYYSTFVEELYQQLNGTASVWAISHSCSSNHKLNKRDTTSLDPLEIEVEHKLRFLEEAVPADCKITLIGHSIGCFMILSVLEILCGLRGRTSSVSEKKNFEGSSFKKDLFSRIKKCYFLFPTIERMKVSSKGKTLWPFLCYFQWLVVGIIYAFSWLPLALRSKIASASIGSNKDSSVVNATVELLTPRMVGNMMHLAYNELQIVNSLHKESIHVLKDKLVLYYGTHDGWAPLSYKDDLINDIPGVRAYVDEYNMDHAFVLKHSKVMASELVRLITLNQ